MRQTKRSGREQEREKKNNEMKESQRREKKGLIK